MQKNSDDFSMREAMRLFQSDTGQQLIALLQQTGGAQLQQAMALAASGRGEEAKDIIEPLLSAPEIQTLLRQLGR